jgi:hypothetical protein
VFDIGSRVVLARSGCSPQLKLVHEHTHPAEQQPESAAAKEGDAQARAELLATLDVEGEEDE